MIIDLKKIQASGKTESNFFFEYEPDNRLSTEFISVLSPVKVSGTVTITDRHSATISGEVCLTLKGQCTRCLKDTEKTLVLEFDEYADESGEDCYAVVNDKIDLAKIVEDLIILNMPVSFLCKEDCKGICSGCGVNLNSDACKCNK